MGLEPTSDNVAACFQNRFLIQSDDFRSNVELLSPQGDQREPFLQAKSVQTIEPNDQALKSSGSWNRTGAPTGTDAGWSSRQTPFEAVPGGFAAPYIPKAASEQRGPIGLLADGAEPATLPPARAMPVRYVLVSPPPALRAVPGITHAHLLLPVPRPGRGIEPAPCGDHRSRRCPHLSYQPNKKSPTSLLTPGLLPSTQLGAECHKRKGYRGCKLAGDGQLPVDMRSWIELSHLNIIAIVPSTCSLLRPTRRY